MPPKFLIRIKVMRRTYRANEPRKQDDEDCSGKFNDLYHSSFTRAWTACAS